ncbi:MAG: antibiotic biosynthesis monooxygenase family protein [bacterium]
MSCKKQYIVVFTATLNQVDEEYRQMARKLRDLALNQYGCKHFESCCEKNQEIALSYWPDLESIQQWRLNPLHVQAKKLGKEKWYSDHKVEICQKIS